MANSKIKGLTIEIGGDTTKLGKALADVDKRSTDLSKELQQINRLLKLDPGNTELIAQKQQVLAKAVAATSEKLETLREAEKQVQKQFERGEVSEEQVRALQREIAQTEQTMRGYEKEAKDCSGATSNFGAAAKTAAGKFGGAMKAVGSAAAASLAVVASLAGAAAVALTKMSVSAAAYADDILTTSTVTGIATDKLQEYAYAAELVDVSVETLTKSQAKNIKSMKSAVDGSKTAAEAYAALGITITNADGSLRDGETVYWEIIDALGQMENETERDAIAMQLLGKSAQELNPLIEAGSEKMAELGQEARDVGAVLSEDALNAMGAFDDSIQRLKGSAGAAKNALGTVLLPELTLLTTGCAELVSEFTQTLNASGGGMEGFVATVETMGPVLADKAAALVTGILEKIVAIAPAIITVGVDLVSQLATSILAMTPQVLDAGVALMVSLLDGLTAALPQVVMMVAEIVPQLARTLEQGVPQLLDSALALLMVLCEAVGLLLPPLIEALPSIIMTLVSGLLGAIPELLDAALLLLMAIVDAIPLLIDQLIPLIPTIVVQVCDALIAAMPQLLQAAFSLFSALWKAIPQACVTLLGQLPQIWSTIWGYLSELPAKLLPIGGDLVRGLFQGMQNSLGWLYDKITGWVGDVLEFIKNLFGIHSPSRAMAYMGEMLDEGLAVGIEDNQDTPKRAMGDVAAGVLDAVGTVDGVAVERSVSAAQSATAAASAAQSAGALSKLDAILAAIERGQVLVIDGAKLVGATAGKMDSALGQQRILAGRSAL